MLSFVTRPHGPGYSRSATTRHRFDQVEEGFSAFPFLLARLVLARVVLVAITGGTGGTAGLTTTSGDAATTTATAASATAATTCVRRLAALSGGWG